MVASLVKGGWAISQCPALRASPLCRSAIGKLRLPASVGLWLPAVPELKH